MNLFLHEAEDFHIHRGETLRVPAFYSGDSPATFNCVVANPPFSLEKWGEGARVNDPHGGNFADHPSVKSGDFAWVRHMVKSTARKIGRMTAVLPHGVLFRNEELAGEFPSSQKIHGRATQVSIILLTQRVNNC